MEILKVFVDVLPNGQIGVGVLAKNAKGAWIVGATEPFPMAEQVNRVADLISGLDAHENDTEFPKGFRPAAPQKITS